jgi:hypothetical protein
MSANVTANSCTVRALAKVYVHCPLKSFHPFENFNLNHTQTQAYCTELSLCDEKCQITDPLFFFLVNIVSSYVVCPQKQYM